MKIRFSLIILLIIVPHFAAASNFVEVKLPRGVKMQIPKGWWVLTAEHNQLIDTSAEAALDVSGIGAVEGSDVNLISANSMPRTTYAAVRVDSSTPVYGSPSEISNLTPAELQAFKIDARRNLLKLLPTQGNRLLAFLNYRRVIISGHPTLITDYRRSGPKGPVIVSIVQIFTPNQNISINLSYRESEQAIWKPVIRKMYKSIVISRWP